MPDGSDVDTQPLSPLRSISICLMRKRSTLAILPKAGPPADGYFAFTLDVIELITVEAILNWSLRLSMP